MVIEQRKHFSIEGWLPSSMISNLKNRKINAPVKLLDKRIIGVFYLYRLIKFKSAFYDGRWNCAQSDFPDRTGMEIDVMRIGLKALEEYIVLNNSHEDYIIGLDGAEYKRLASSYSDCVKDGEIKLQYSKGRESV